MNSDFSFWVNSLDPESNLESWADNYDLFCKSGGENRPWENNHGGEPAESLRDHLLSAVRRLVIPASDSTHQATRIFAWNIEKNSPNYSYKIYKDKVSQPSRFTIGTIYELGEIINFKANRPLPNGIETTSGSGLQRKCAQVRAETRTILDEENFKKIRQFPYFSQFVTYDLACAFEWKRERLLRYLEIFQKTLKHIKEYGKTSPHARQVHEPILKENSYMIELQDNSKYVFHAPSSSATIIQQATTLSLSRLSDQTQSTPLLDLLKVKTVLMNDKETIYDTPPEANTSPAQSRPASYKELQKKLDSEKPILLMTVTGDEYDAARSLLEPIENNGTWETDLQMSQTCLGKLQDFLVLVARSEMGSSGLGASFSTTAMILDLFPQIRCVISVGICFGSSRKRQRYGDVVVASQILPYESQRVNPGNSEPEYRGYPLPAGPLLHDAFCKTDESAYDFTPPNSNRKQRVHLGAVLSGEKLVDSTEFRDALVARWSNVVGGEMEGVGIYAACFGRPGVQAILVKSICDFADGVKDDRWQKYCANVAASYCKEILKDRSDQIKLILAVPEDEEEDATE